MEYANEILIFLTGKILIRSVQVILSSSWVQESKKNKSLFLACSSKQINM